MIRTFIGVAIDSLVAGRIAEAEAKLAGKLSAVRWVRKDQLHFTLKFLGSIEEGEVARIGDTLRTAVGPFSRFPVLARGMGVFPDIRRAKVLWVGLEGTELKSLAESVEAGLETIGFTREKRAFKPHLTIGRWRNFRGRPEQLRSELDEWKNYKFGESWVEEVGFFQSILKSEGALYHPLSTIRLAN